MDTVKIRFDGTQESMRDEDNLCFTIMSHFIGADGRDFFKASFIGVQSLLRCGLNLDNVRIVGKGGK